MNLKKLILTIFFIFSITKISYGMEHSKKSLRNTEKINLLIGNPAGVRLFVNDKELPVSGKPGEPLRVSLPQDIASQ